MEFSQPNSAANVVESGLSRLATIVTGGALAVSAFWFLFDAPEVSGDPRWLIPATVLIIAALAIAILGRRAGAMPRQHVSIMVVWIGNAALAIVVAGKLAAGLIGWWSQIEIIAIGVIAGAAVLAPTWRAFVAGVFTLAASSLMVLPQTTADGLSITPVELIAREASLALVFGIIFAFSVLNRRSAGRTDLRLTMASTAAEEQADSRARVWAAQRARATMHDTLLNTLAAVAHGVPDERLGDLRDRCASDIARWESDFDSLPKARANVDTSDAGFAAAIRRLQYTGMAVENRVEGLESDLPPDVSAAIADSVEELLRNVHRHSGVAQAVVSGQLVAGQATVTVADSGRGFDVDEHSFDTGLATSVMARCAAVGARAHVRSRPGEGTIVVINWRASHGDDTDSESGRSAIDLGISDSIRQASAWIVLAASLTALITIGVDRTGFDRPLLAAGVVLGIAAILAALLWVDRTRGIEAPEATIAVLVAGTVVMIAPLADPYCATWSWTSALPDNRILLLVVPALLLGSKTFTLVASAAYVGAAMVAATLWGQLWPGCGFDYIFSALGAAVLVVGAGQMGSVVRQQSRLSAHAREMDLNTRLQASRVRARQEILSSWEMPVVSSALELLKEIEGDSTAASDPRVREQARLLATRLRTRVTCAGTVGVLADSLRRLIDVAERNSISIEIFGDPMELEQADPLAADVADSLDTWVRSQDISDAEGVSIRVSTTSHWQAILVNVQPHPKDRPSEPSESAHGPALRESTHDQDGPAGVDLEVESWADELGFWWRSQWTPGGLDRPSGIEVMSP